MFIQTYRKLKSFVVYLWSRSQANQGPQQMNTTKTTIAIKYPKKYEDAQEIVELLIENECVLIDFQYMLEAQARRCLDFIDGASKVLTGNLQKLALQCTCLRQLMSLLTSKRLVGSWQSRS